MNKAEREKRWRDDLIPVGVQKYAVMYDHGNFYWCFFMKNGTQRYWTNPSFETLILLGVDEEYARRNIK